MNLNRKLFILLIILTQALTACGSASPAAPEAADPAAVVQSFYDAYNQADTDAAMALVADDIQCRGHCYLNGKDAFRAFIQQGIDGGDQIEISDLRVTDDKVVFNYVIYRSDVVSARGVDSVMQVKDGKIILFEIK